MHFRWKTTLIISFFESPKIVDFLEFSQLLYFLRKYSNFWPATFSCVCQHFIFVTRPCQYSLFFCCSTKLLILARTCHKSNSHLKTDDQWALQNISISCRNMEFVKKNKKSWGPRNVNFSWRNSHIFEKQTDTNKRGPSKKTYNYCRFSLKRTMDAQPQKGESPTLIDFLFVCLYDFDDSIG